jgi:quercetin 2,3-dioxygenase
VRTLRPASARYRTEQPGITSWHSFSAGGHYDPDNVAFGPLVGVDEHVLAPGAGFDWHGHRGVHIVSWVLAGALRHEDSTGAVRIVEPGVLLVQATGTGIRHTETNASDTAPLRFVQTTVVGADGPAVWTTPSPLVLPGVTIEVVTGPVRIGGPADAHVLVLAGAGTVDGDPLAAGDTVRVDDGTVGMISGAGELLVTTLDATNGERDAHG